jgi:hypothetical protein
MGKWECRSKISAGRDTLTWLRRSGFAIRPSKKSRPPQQANEWDMSGHAAKAKELLDQASHELKQAAESANKH